MKNIDKYKNDLIDLIIDRLAVTKANGVCDCQYTMCSNCIFQDDDGECIRDARKWLNEEFEGQPILEKAEKEYLENVLRPFKNEIKWVRKTHHQYSGYDHLIDNNGIQYFCLIPQYFKGETICKGMKLNKEYTLKELGLFEGE